LWFQKMDRNQDGDISPREFIGSDEDFRKLDADGDGPISATEATHLEERVKKDKDKKR
jgi:Ca2+-binding EF-hand superfamily protein